jgi:heme/copper-type cytochrome/quinol oxidase subunit 2
MEKIMINKFVRGQMPKKPQKPHIKHFVALVIIITIIMIIILVIYPIQVADLWSALCPPNAVLPEFLGKRARS